MKIDEANKIAIKVKELKDANSRLVVFRKTGEFCKIRISGEDGFEKEFHFIISAIQHKSEVKKIRELIKDILTDNINNLYSELESL